MNAVELTAYDTTKQLIHNHTEYDSDNPTMYILYGMSAGFFGITIGTPIDVVKTRMMNAGNEFTGALHCAKSLVKTDGILGLYRGYRPSIIRGMGFNSILFYVVGHVRHYMSTKDE